MKKSRLEAFSDGVIAILITIMVLELHTPHGATLAALRPLLPTLLAYVLSFVYMGIYWNSHHHLIYAVRRVSGAVLWANLHLLFWLSLVPFTTAWVGEAPRATLPTAIYGVVLLCAGIAFTVLQVTLLRANGPDSPLARALGSDVKGKASLALYALGIALAFVSPWAADAAYVGVALMWLIPDRRIETTVGWADDVE